MRRTPRLRHTLTVTALLALAAWSAPVVARLAPATGSQDEASTSRASDKKRAKAERQAEKERKRRNKDLEAPVADAPAESASGGDTSPTDPEGPVAPVPEAGASATASQESVAEEETLDPSDFTAEPVDAEADAPAETGGEDATTLLADSLAAYESAQTLWEQGLAEEAFAALDHAYELMAAVDIESEPLHAQEKEDLRRLISRRVVEIYASRPTAAGDVEGSIPIDINDHVKREIASFSGPERQFFLDAYTRSGQYRPMMIEELRTAGLPLELAWMPIVESGFKVRAYSVARALGLWQFIPSTGYRFGLSRNNWIDERMDPQKSTRAAITYLTELHGLFGDWLTALAAYNCGEHLVLRLLSSQPVSYFDHFWDLYLRLPRETRRYVPRFLAVLAILEDPAAYGFELPDPAEPLAFDRVHTERTADLGELERRLELPDGTIKGLNPELRRNATPPGPYEVKVPAGTVDQVAAAFEKLPTRVVTADVAPSASGTHRVRPGETLSRVAARYGTTVNALVAWNGLQSADRIWPGQILKVRSSASSASSGSSSAGGANRVHRVRNGDNLWLIAQRYGTTVDRIKSDNGLRSNLLHIGQRLVIRSSGSAAGGG